MSTPIRIAKGTAGGAAVNSLTIAAIALTSGSALVVGLVFEQVMSVTSLRWGSADLTLIDAQLVQSDAVLSHWRLSNASGGTADLVLTLAGGDALAEMIATAWEDVDLTPVDQNAEASGTSTSLSATTSTTEQRDEVLIAHAFTHIRISDFPPVGDENFGWTGGLVAGQQRDVTHSDAIYIWKLREAWKILTVTGVQTASATLNSPPENWGMAAVTLKATAARPRTATLLGGTRTAVLKAERDAKPRTATLRGGTRSALLDGGPRTATLRSGTRTAVLETERA
jgi:hypothetical protein